VATDPVGALRRERLELLRLCHDLADAEWQTQSAAAGWHVFRRIESGPMRVTRTAEPDEVSLRVVSGPDLDGAAISPVTVWKGQRWSTAHAIQSGCRAGLFAAAAC
jgi:hypothetical protein